MNRIPLLCVISVGVTAVPVLAQDYEMSADADRKQKAKAAYIRGQQLAQRGNLQAAIGAVQESYALYPTAGSLYALGLLYEQTDNSSEAVDHYQRALAAPNLPGNIKASVEMRLRVLGAPSAAVPGSVTSQRSRIESNAPAKDNVQTGWLSGSGFFIEGGAITNLMRLEGGFWPAAAAGYGFPFGIVVRAEVMAPFATLNAGLAWEMLNTPLRPFAWAQAGYALVRSLQDDTSGGFLITFGAGLKWYPWKRAGLWGAIRAGVALDMARERTSTPIPIMLSVGYQL